MAQTAESLDDRLDELEAEKKKREDRLSTLRKSIFQLLGRLSSSLSARRLLALS